MTRVLSGIQPTGEVHLGNYLGALRHWTTEQHEHDAFFCVVDLHAITMPQDPRVLHDKCLEMGAALLAIGLDPTVCTLFFQSHVPEHTELCWLLSCVASMGELRRMTQFKDKTARLGESGTEAVPVGLFTYPVLQAADILLYDADRVPVGADQKQHIELTRDIAQRFNHRYGETFVLPAPAIPAIGARVMDLQDPTSKMSKSTESDVGRIGLFEPQKSIERKFKRAVTDTDTEVRFDPDGKPGVSNLLSIMAALSGEAPQQIATRYTQYGPLKADALELTLHALAPIRERHAELMADPAETLRLLGVGADKAREIASHTVTRAKQAMGFVARYGATR